ncbi:MAG TPA: hypothetical protein VN943_00490 [Candidatus Acidoferrum sp.]|nr:hypothetical protein [Candidatus Acidoferrum sp.]
MIFVAIALAAAAVCLWAWPALEAEETKRQRQAREATPHLTPGLTEQQIIDRAMHRKPPPAGRSPR